MQSRNNIYSIKLLQKGVIKGRVSTKCREKYDKMLK